MAIDNNDQDNADDPFAGWAEALEEQKTSDNKAPLDDEQGGPLSGQPARAGYNNAGGDIPVSDINMVLDIPVQLSVELGRTKVPIKYILQLAQGSVVELDALAGDSIADCATHFRDCVSIHLIKPTLAQKDKIAVQAWLSAKLGNAYGNVFKAQDRHPDHQLLNYDHTAFAPIKAFVETLLAEIEAGVTES